VRDDDAVGCFLLLIAFLSPRLALFFTLLFTDLLGDAFDSWVVPVLGFLFLPWTTLAYVWMWDSGHSVDGLEWFLVVFAFLVDLGAAGRGARYRQGTGSG
jgi:hypothetical protein